jgi:alpha-glucosidase (family GH31 glycosyl hydrolase)
MQWPSVPVAWPDWTNPATESWLVDMLKLWGESVEIPDGIWLDMNEVSSNCVGELNPNCYTPGNPDGRILDPNAGYHPQINLPTDIPYPPYQPGKDIETIEQKSFNISSWLHFGRAYDTKEMWGFMETRLYSQAFEKIQKKRAFVLSRSNFMGHGYRGAHWLGDNQSTWPSLQLSIASAIAMGIYGIPMVGADICGFGDATTPPLCARWTQLGALYPFARNHNDESNPPQEPYVFAEPYLSMMRNAINLRYSLLTHFYTLYVNAHYTGEPLWRALFMEFPMDSLTYAIDQQVMLGDSFLIIPIVDNENSVNVTGYVPNDDWFDWHTSARVASFNSNSNSGKNMTFTSEYNVLSYIPLLFRGGHIVPTQTPQLSSYETLKTPFVLHVALNGEGHAFGDAYVDDGETIDAHDIGLFNHLQFNGSLYVDSSNFVQGTFSYTLAHTTANFSLDGLSISSIIVMGLDLTSSFNPTAQPVFVDIGNTGNPYPLKQDIAVLNGALVLSQASEPFLPVNQPFTLYFGYNPSRPTIASF